MGRSFEVIDADGHITDTDAKLKEYLEAPYRSRRVAVYPSDNWDRSLGGTLGTRAPDAKSWLDALDAAEVSTSVLFPTAGLGFGWLREPDLAVAVARAYNNMVSEQFQKASPRLKAVALVPLQDAPEGVKELRRAIAELGLVGVMLPAIGLRKPLGHPDYWPIYEEAERLDVMVGVHATVRGGHYFGADIFDQFIDVHTLSHPFAQMMQMTSMVMRGVLDRYPKLRIAFMEAGCSWVPYWAGRMDEEWEHRGKVEAPLCRKRPSQYIKSDRIYFHAEDYEPFIGATAEYLSPEVLYYASDWPHWDSEFPENIEALARREDLTAENKKWLLAETAKRLYKLNGT